MTNAELIQAIKAEIERLKGQLIRGACAAQIEMETNCKEEAYDEILSFLSNLESEKLMKQEKEVEPCHRTRKKLAEWSKTPEGRVAYEKVAQEMRNEIAITNNPDESENPMQDGLEEDLEKEIKDTCRGYRINDYHEQELGKHDIENIARHFAQWGAEHLKK